MNYYDKINWKNRSEGKTTKISAERLNHMDNQIFNNANAIGNVEKIADIGDGTLCGAAETLKETAEKLTQSLSDVNSNLDKKVNTSDIVNNLTSTSTTKPLSAAQGKALNDNLNYMSKPIYEKDVTADGTYTYTAPYDGIYGVFARANAKDGSSKPQIRIVPARGVARRNEGAVGGSVTTFNSFNMKSGESFSVIFNNIVTLNEYNDFWVIKFR